MDKLQGFEREIVDRVRKGQPVVVQSYGEDQVVLLDALDYRILRGVVNYPLSGEIASAVETADEALNDIIQAYLDKHISLAKAAEQLGFSRFDLMERFERLGVPLHIGPTSIDETREEIKAAHKGQASLT